MNWKNSEERCSQEGQVKCRHCYGKKFISYFAPMIFNELEFTEYRCPCPKCKGTGTVLWIDEVVGRNRKRRKRQWKKPKGAKNVLR